MRPLTGSLALLVALTLVGCVGGVSEEPAGQLVEEVSEAEIDETVAAEGPGTVLEWELRSFSMSEDGFLEAADGVSGLQIFGTPTPADIRATAEEALKQLRAEYQYRGLDLPIYSEPMEPFSERGFYLGSVRDTPFGVELDRVDEVDFEAYDDYFAEVVAFWANWADVPTAVDYTIWLAYNDALVETQIDLDAGDVAGQREARERRALISVSSDFDIDEDLVLEGFTRFDDFTDEYETYEFQIAGK